MTRPIRLVSLISRKYFLVFWSWLFKNSRKIKLLSRTNRCQGQRFKQREKKVIVDLFYHNLTYIVSKITQMLLKLGTYLGILILFSAFKLKMFGYLKLMLHNTSITWNNQKRQKKWSLYMKLSFKRGTVTLSNIKEDFIK